MRSLLFAFLAISCGYLSAQSVSVGQWELRKRNANGTMTSYGVTAENGKAIGFTADVPAMLAVGGSLTIGSSTITSGTSGRALYNNSGVLGELDLASLYAPISHNQAWSTITSTPTTLAGYGITDAITAATAASTYAPLASPTFTGTVTIPSGASISGYLTSATAASTYAPISHNQAWSTITSTPTTLAGYGITDAITAATAASTYAPISHNQAWSTITSTPTTLAGYGITDAITAATAASTYAPLASPTFTGTITTGTGGIVSPNPLFPTRNITISQGTFAWQNVGGSGFGVQLTPDTPTDDRFVSFNPQGNLVSTADTGTVTSTMILDGTIANGDLAGSIALSKLAITGTPDGTKYLRDDGTWQAISHNQAWSTITSTPTTLAGYGITDALTAATAASTYAPISHNQAWSTITSTPTTLAGYGITDAITAATAASTYAPIASPTFTGTVTVGNTAITTSGLTITNLLFPTRSVGIGDVGISWNNAGGSGFSVSLSPTTPTDNRAVQFNPNGAIVSTADTGTVTNTMLAGSIAASKLVGTDIATVGTITSGTWQGSVIAPAYLGTGSSISTKYLRGDGTWQTIAGGGDALTSSPLSQFAATTSAQLAGVISDETGSGALVFGTSPTLTTPALGTPSSVTLTNATGLPLSTGITGTLAITNGGTGQTSATNAFDALAPTTTKGDLIVSNGTDNVRLPVGGTNGHVLTVDSAESTGVKWAAASGGGGSGGNWVLISTTTISGSPSTVDITFSGSYRRYRLELENVYCSADGYSIRMRTSTDGGSTFDSSAANYGYAYGPLGTYGPTSTTSTYIEMCANFVGSATDEGIWGEIEFFDPLNTSLKSFARWSLFGRTYNSASPNLIQGAGYRDSAADVDAVRLFFSTGNLAGGKVRLFGWSE